MHTRAQANQNAEYKQHWRRLQRHWSNAPADGPAKGAAVSAVAMATMHPIAAQPNKRHLYQLILGYCFFSS